MDINHNSNNNNNNKNPSITISEESNPNDQSRSKQDQQPETSASTTVEGNKQKASEKEMVGGCVICGIEVGYVDNVICYCDGECQIGVHEACYGIGQIPDNEWYCRPCSMKVKPERCVLCPANYGAFKQTPDGKWCHVVCAVYIQEVEFGDTTNLEPILLDKLDLRQPGHMCILCEMSGRDKEISCSGYCMSCHYQNCPNKFHVTCAQYQGFLCEELTPNHRVRNKAFCPQHIERYRNLRKPKLRILPAYRPEDPNRKQPLLLNDEHDNSSSRPTLNLPSTPSSSVSSVSPVTPQTKRTALSSTGANNSSLAKNHNQSQSSSSNSSVAKKDKSRSNNNNKSNGKSSAAKSPISTLYNSSTNSPNAQNIKKSSSSNVQTNSKVRNGQSFTGNNKDISSMLASTTTAISVANKINNNNQNMQSFQSKSLLSSPLCPNESLTVPRKRTLSSSSSSSSSSSASSSSSSSNSSSSESQIMKNNDNKSINKKIKRDRRKAFSSSSEDTHSSDSRASEEDDSDDSSGRNRSSPPLKETSTTNRSAQNIPKRHNISNKRILPTPMNVQSKLNLSDESSDEEENEENEDNKNDGEEKESSSSSSDSDVVKPTGRTISKPNNKITKASTNKRPITTIGTMRSVANNNHYSNKNRRLKADNKSSTTINRSPSSKQSLLAKDFYVDNHPKQITKGCGVISETISIVENHFPISSSTIVSPAQPQPPSTQTKSKRSSATGRASKISSAPLVLSDDDDDDSGEDDNEEEDDDDKDEDFSLGKKSSLRQSSSTSSMATKRRKNSITKMNSNEKTVPKVINRSRSSSSQQSPASTAIISSLLDDDDSNRGNAKSPRNNKNKTKATRATRGSRKSSRSSAANRNASLTDNDNMGEEEERQTPIPETATIKSPLTPSVIGTPAQTGGSNCGFHSMMNPNGCSLYAMQPSHHLHHHHLSPNCCSLNGTTPTVPGSGCCNVALSINTDHSSMMVDPSGLNSNNLHSNVLAGGGDHNLLQTCTSSLGPANPTASAVSMNQSNNPLLLHHHHHPQQQLCSSTTAASAATTVPKARSQMPFSPLMVPCFGPNIVPNGLQNSSLSPTLEMPPTPRSLEELLEFSWVNMSHFQMTQEEVADASYLLQKLNGILKTRKRLEKERKSLEKSAQMIERITKLAREAVMIEKGEETTDHDDEYDAIENSIKLNHNDKNHHNHLDNPNPKSGSNSTNSRPESIGHGDVLDASPKNHNSSLLLATTNHHRHGSTVKSGSSTPVLNTTPTRQTNTNINTSLSNILAATTSRLRNNLTENGGGQSDNGGGIGLGRMSRRSSNSSTSLQQQPITTVGAAPIHSQTESPHQKPSMLSNNNMNQHQLQNHSIHSNPLLGHQQQPQQQQLGSSTAKSNSNINMNTSSLLSSSSSSMVNSMNNPNNSTKSIVPESYQHYLAKQLNSTSNVISAHNLPATTGYIPSPPSSMNNVGVGYSSNGGLNATVPPPPPPPPPPPHFRGSNGTFEASSSSSQHHLQHQLEPNMKNSQYHQRPPHHHPPQPQSSFLMNNNQQQPQQFNNHYENHNQYPPPQQSTVSNQRTRTLRSSTAAAASSATNTTTTSMSNGPMNVVVGGGGGVGYPPQQSNSSTMSSFGPPPPSSSSQSSSALSFNNNNNNNNNNLHPHLQHIGYYKN